MVGRERLQDHVVDGVDVLRVSGHRDPAERPYALAEQRTDIEIDKGAHPKGVFDAGGLRFGAQAVAVFEHDRAAIHESKHRANMRGDGFPCQRDQSLRIAGAHGAGFFERQFHGHIALQGIGKGLVGDDVGQDAALGEFG